MLQWDGFWSPHQISSPRCTGAVWQAGKELSTAGWHVPAVPWSTSGTGHALHRCLSLRRPKPTEARSGLPWACRRQCLSQQAGAQGTARGQEQHGCWGGLVASPGSVTASRVKRDKFLLGKYSLFGVLTQTAAVTLCLCKRSLMGAVCSCKFIMSCLKNLGMWRSNIF